MLTPVGGGLFLPAMIATVGQHVIAPGSPVELSGQVSPAPDGALFGIVAVDEAGWGVWYYPADSSPGAWLPWV